MKRRNRVVVRSGVWQPILLGILVIPLAAYSVWGAVVTKVNFFYMVAAVCLGTSIFNLIDYKNRKIIIYRWGIVVSDRLGHVAKIRFDEISAVRLESVHYYTRVYLNVSGIDMITFYSTDDNYTEFMDILNSKIPEAIVWEGSSWF